MVVTRPNLVLAAILLLATACGSPMVILEMNLHQGELRAPDESHRLHLRDDRRFRIMRPDEMKGTSARVALLIVHGHAAPYEFALRVSPSTFLSSELRVVVDTQRINDSKIVIRDAQYTVNDKAPKPLVFSDGYLRASIDESYSAKVFRLELPDELAALPIREHGDGILNPEDLASELERQRYRFVIEIHIDEARYVLDAELSFELGTGTRFGIPGTP